MTLTLRPITADNWEDCVRLKVAPDQEEFVASNAFSLAQAAYEADCVPHAIYADELMVGFLMYWHLPPATTYHVNRLMIDAAQQRQGYGRLAMEHLIAALRAKADCHQIEITYAPTNAAARHLYAQLGFVETGDLDDGEVVAQLDL